MTRTISPYRSSLRTRINHPSANTRKLTLTRQAQHTTSLDSNPNSFTFPGDEAEITEAKQEDGEDVQEAVGQRENENEEEALQERKRTKESDPDSLIYSYVP